MEGSRPSFVSLEPSSLLGVEPELSTRVLSSELERSMILDGPAGGSISFEQPDGFEASTEAHDPELAQNAPRNATVFR